METPFDPDDDFSDDFPPPGWEEMDADEKHECAQAHLARLRKQRADLLKRGPEAAYFVEELDRQIKPLAEAVAAMQAKIDDRDAKFENYLQAIANYVDKVNEAYPKLETFAQWLARQFPNGPKVQQIKASFDEQNKALPKDQVPPNRTLEELEAELRKKGLMKTPPSGASRDKPAPPT